MHRYGSAWRLAHRLDERPHQLRHLLVPPAQRRFRDLEPFPRVDAFEALERLVVLPAPHDRVASIPGPAMPRSIGISTAAGARTSVASPRLRSLRTYFL